MSSYPAIRRWSHEELEELLVPGNLELPAAPQLSEIRVGSAENIPEDAVRIWLIVPDNTPEEALDAEFVRRVRGAIGRKLRSQGLDLIPLTKLRKRSEFEQEVEG